MIGSEYESEMIWAVLRGGLTPDAVDVIDKISPDMITNHFYKTVWTEIKRRASAGEPIDSEALQIFEIADKENGLQIFAEQGRNTVGSPHGIKGYAKRVRQSHSIRNAQVILGEAMNRLSEVKQDSDIGEAHKYLEDALSHLTIETDDKKPRSFDEISEQYLTTLEDRLTGSNAERMIKTGIEALDDLTGGFNMSDLIVLGGTPGMGKTELLMRIMRGAVTGGMGALMFSMEMDEFQVVERAISGEGGISVGSLRNPRGMRDEDYAKMSAGMGRLMGEKMHILDQGGLSVEQVCSVATKHKQRYPDTAIIGVDYLGMMKIGKADRHDIAVGDISRRLKQLAKELKTPVVLLVQLTSKAIEGRPANNRIPMPSDIKDSSRVQDDADWILFPYRHSVYVKDCHNVAQIVIGKARHGIQGGVAYQRFIDGHFVDCDQAHAHNEVEMYNSSQSSGSRTKDF